MVILWVLTYVPESNAMRNGRGTLSDNRTCTADECEKMADIIRKQMGSEPPCEDFNDYVCGNWSGERELNVTVLKKKAVRTLAGLLQNASVPRRISNATHKLLLAYKSCEKNGEDRKALNTSIANVIALFNLTSKIWPIIEETGRKPPGKENDDYVDVLKKTGPRPVYLYSVSEQGGKPIILMSKPWDWDFYVHDAPEYNSETASETEQSPDYAEYDEQFVDDEKAYKIFIMKTIALVNDSIQEKIAESVANDIIDIEKKLSKLASQANETQEKEMNLSQLCDLLGGKFPMAEILQRDFEGLNISITGETNVLVQYVDYYQSTVTLLKCTSMMTLSNYILWTYIREMAKAEGTLLHAVYLEYKHNTSLNFADVEHNNEAADAAKRGNLSLLCVRQLLEVDIMYTAVANFYITAKFNQTFKKDVLKIMKFVNSSFMHVVKNNTWMTNHTKGTVITKLQNMAAIIGYPGWMLNKTVINSLYQFVPINISKNASFVEHFYYLQENNHKQTLLKLEPGRYINKMNEDTPLRSHAYYVGDTNTIVYPAAALVTHYRSPPIPRSANYGTIGTILAQLLTVLLDRYSDLSKETGKYNKDNWDNQTAENFCNRSTCLNNTEECNGTQHMRMKHKYEKLQDYVGVRVSYLAMVNSKANYTLPYLLPDGESRFDSESKIFFIFFGSLYCPFSVNEKHVNEERVSERLLVQSRPREEDKFPKSLNEIVYTYKEFNTTFNCTRNPDADTCDLMPPEDVAPPFGC